MNKRLSAVLCMALLGLFLAMPAKAAEPDPSKNPVLASIQKMGAKLFYLGKRDGLDGWFIVKNGQVQIAYATADNKEAVIGALFGQDGENVTVLQIDNLMRSNKEVADLIGSAKSEQAAITQVGSPPVNAPVNTGIPSAPLSPGERLVNDLRMAAGVVVGNSASPEILMVMDPHCTHCQATWKALRDVVMKGTAHIRMIPIGDKDSDNERAAAVLLTSADPLNTWDKYVAGDRSLLAGTPNPSALAAVRANHQVTDSWHISVTPYLVYRAKDGKIKIVAGEPDKLSLITNDMGL